MKQCLKVWVGLNLLNACDWSLVIEYIALQSKYYQTTVITTICLVY